MLDGAICGVDTKKMTNMDFHDFHPNFWPIFHANPSYTMSGLFGVRSTR